MSAGHLASMGAKKWLLFGVKLALTVACLGWALSDVDWQQSALLDPLALGWAWVVPGLILAGATVWLSALRLWLLLRAQGIGLSLWQATELTLIGNLFNLVTVGGIGGDAVRIFMLIRDYPDRKVAISLTVMFDHLVGMVAMALVFFTFTAGRFDALTSQSIETVGILRFAWGFFLGGMILIGLMFFMSFPPIHNRVHKHRQHSRFAFLNKVPVAFDMFRQKWPQVVMALAVSFAMLPVYYASFWCGTKMVGSDAELGPVLVAMPVVDLLSALPISVAGLGVREVSMKILMHDLTGMAASVAVAAMMIGFFFSLLWALLGAGLFLRSGERVSMEKIEAAVEDDADVVEWDESAPQDE